MADAEIASLLRDCGTIAVVGLTDNPDKASYGVARYLQQCGYKIVPVNPRKSEILGEKCYASLADVPGPVDIVDIFRRSEKVPQVVDQAIANGAKAVWMQAGIVNEESAEKARSCGMKVIMNRCIKIEHRQLKAEGLL